MPPWVLAHPAGSSLIVNKSNARCVPDAWLWGSTALSGRGDTVIQGLEEGLGGGILTALGTPKKKIFKNLQ